MPSISSNIYKNLTSVDKSKLRADGKKLGKVKIYEYKELSLEALEFAKFIFDDFSIINFFRDNLIWEGLITLAASSYRIAIKRHKNPEVHFWITDKSGSFPVNIAFASKDVKDVVRVLQSLKQKLPNLLEKHKLQKGEIVWISYDSKSNAWKIKVF